MNISTFTSQLGLDTTVFEKLTKWRQRTVVQFLQFKA